MRAFGGFAVVILRLYLVLERNQDHRDHPQTRAPFLFCKRRKIGLDKIRKR